MVVAASLVWLLIFASMLLLGLSLLTVCATFDASPASRTLVRRNQIGEKKETKKRKEHAHGKEDEHHT